MSLSSTSGSDLPSKEPRFTTRHRLVILLVSGGVGYLLQLAGAPVWDVVVAIASVVIALVAIISL